MRVVVITPPEPVVTWEEAAAQLRLSDDDEQQAYVEGLIAAATAHLDGPAGWLGRALGLQTLELYLPSFGVGGIGLPFPPAIDLVTINYLDGNGSAETLQAADVDLRGNLLGPVWPNSWPVAQWRGCGGETVRIRYRAGYALDADADPVEPSVPAPIKQAILLMVADLFHSRATIATGASMTAVPMSLRVEELLQPYRVYR